MCVRSANAKELARIAAQPFARFEPDEKYMQELMLGLESGVVRLQ